ncbi:unnamed protein product [Caenorhabditis angaria]|uniref:Uncharacterized protein n=1 Tax=Caenorhabditis angaria TaxID=860376 RepID=A0A9P1N386_9PELO|nr:unnamed protein product [Caenorhabditis angaria]
MLKLENLSLVPETVDPVDERIIYSVETVQFVVVCFTVPFYITILFYLIVAQFQRIDELCTPFFKLCITTAIIDLFTLFTNYCGAMFPKWGWNLNLYLYLNNFYIRPYFFLAWFSGVAQAMSVSIMATNRLSAIIFPNLHYLYWSANRMKIAYSLQFIPGFLIGFCTYLSPAKLYRSEKNGIVPKLVDETVTFYLFGLCGVFMIVVCTYLSKCELNMDIKDLELVVTNASALIVSQKIESQIETLQFCFVCFTVPFYFLIMFYIIKAQFGNLKDLKSPFFKLCISTAIVDIWTLFTNYFGALFPKWGWGVSIYIWLERIGLYSHVYLYFAWSTGICQAISVSVLAANRLSGIIFPNKYRSFWCGTRLKMAIFIQFAIGLSIGISTFFNPTQIYRNEKDGIVPRFLNKTMTKQFFIIGGVFLVINCLFLVFSYCYLLFILRKRNNKLFEAKASNFHRRNEQRLFMMSTIIVGIQFIVFLLFFNKAANIIQLTSETFYLFYNVISDLYSGVNPYLLWIFSESLRKYICCQLGLHKLSSPIVSVFSIQ